MPRKTKNTSKDATPTPVEKVSSDQEARTFVKTMLSDLWQQSSQFTEPKSLLLPDEIPSKQELPEELQDALEEAKQLTEQCKLAQKRLSKEQESLEQKQTEIDKEKQGLRDKQKLLEKKEIDLTTTERALAEREANAVAHFSKQNKVAIESLNQQVLELTQQYRDMQIKIAGERTLWLQQWEEEHRKLRQTFESSLEQERQKFITYVETERQALQKAKEKLTQDRLASEEELRNMEAELHKRENKLQIQEQILQEDQASLQELIELKGNEEVKRMKLQLQSEREMVQLLQKEYKILESQLRSYQELNVKFSGKEPDEILKEIRKKDSEIQRLRSELAERPGIEIIQQMENLKQEYERVRNQLSSISTQYLQVKNQLEHTLINAVQEQTQREMIRSLENRCSILNSYVTKLEEEVNKYKKFTELPKERHIRIGVIEEPLYKIKRDPPNSKTDEYEWLQQISEEMSRCGFYFPKRLLYAFHTSLKTVEWSSLTVLTGISGTGKSELPRLYSRFGGLEFEAIAVQPNWDSPQDLFGFFNYMDNRFNAKPLLRAMVQSQLPKDRGGFNDGLLMVLLDEMNLARIEQYFSDLLSKLELRRGETQIVYLNIDLGSGLEPYAVPLGKNVFFVGTVNEDESTQTLSDKALDRSNVISFPSPTHFLSRESMVLSDKKAFLPLNVWQNWLREPTSLHEDVRNRIRTTVEEINQCLTHVGRALGHRVWQSMESYIANHPTVCKVSKDFRQAKESSKASKNNVENGHVEKIQEACQRAFEDQIVQKIMPKLRGIETEGNARKYCLDPIAEILRKEAIGLLEDYQNACDKGHGTFLWHTAKFLENDSED